MFAFELGLGVYRLHSWIYQTKWYLHAHFLFGLVILFYSFWKHAIHFFLPSILYSVLCEHSHLICSIIVQPTAFRPHEKWWAKKRYTKPMEKLWRQHSHENNGMFFFHINNGLLCYQVDFTASRIIL